MGNDREERRECGWKREGEDDQSWMFEWEQRYQSLMKVVI
jgi:hypothetical protein